MLVKGGPGNKPLTEPMLTKVYDAICVKENLRKYQFWLSSLNITSAKYCNIHNNLL